MGVGGAERVGGFCIERDVEMHTCFSEIAGLQGSRIDGFEEHGEIFETFEGAIGSAFDQIAGLSSMQSRAVKMRVLA